MILCSLLVSIMHVAFSIHSVVYCMLKIVKDILYCVAFCNFGKVRKPRRTSVGAKVKMISCSLLVFIMHAAFSIVYCMLKIVKDIYTALRFVILYLPSNCSEYLVVNNKHVTFSV